MSYQWCPKPLWQTNHPLQCHSGFPPHLYQHLGIHPGWLLALLLNTKKSFKKYALCCFWKRFFERKHEIASNTPFPVIPNTHPRRVTNKQNTRQLKWWTWDGYILWDRPPRPSFVRIRCKLAAKIMCPWGFGVCINQVGSRFRQDYYLQTCKKIQSFHHPSSQFSANAVRLLNTFCMDIFVLRCTARAIHAYKRSIHP